MICQAHNREDCPERACVNRVRQDAMLIRNFEELAREARLIALITAYGDLREEYGGCMGNRNGPKRQELLKPQIAELLEQIRSTLAE